MLAKCFFFFACLWTELESRFINTLKKNAVLFFVSQSYFGFINCQDFTVLNARARHSDSNNIMFRP